MKPAYRVPTMREIEALPWNGFKVASTFSGCGGSCLGYRMVGYRVADREARMTSPTLHLTWAGLDAAVDVIAAQAPRQCAAACPRRALGVGSRHSRVHRDGGQGPDAMQMGGPRAEVLKGPGASVAPYTAWTRASGSCQFSRRLQAPPVGCARRPAGCEDALSTHSADEAERLLRGYFTGLWQRCVE